MNLTEEFLNENGILVSPVKVQINASSDSIQIATKQVIKQLRAK